MRIRMLVDMTGTRDGQPWPNKGQEADLPTAAAAHLVASGVAEEVTDEPPRRKRRSGGDSDADERST
ncbi:hypothetical protein AMK26_10360 [Streptomyces sp. CB03234]|uniref:hypothetical protein n=1 Tax=Streptomyces sp. (strain CB03234) TaxID=1703937 RepID=UPI00093B5302|nr:hypothetical protein [Streptomyces sp. CB03234]OKK06419.1 hypothetical protein AMK26_10360 [Streptomyces sp. CB03234]